MARHSSASLGLQNPTSLYSAPYTVGSGPDRLLVVTCFGDVSDLVTDIAYGGTSLSGTVIKAQGAGGGAGDRWLYVAWMLNPPSGSHNVTVAASSAIAIQVHVADYEDVKQSGQPDASGSAVTVISQTSLGKAVSVTAPNSWLVAAVRENGGDTTESWTNVTGLQDGGGLHLADSNGPVASGSITVAAAGASATRAIIVVSFAPDAAPVFGSEGFQPISQPSPHYYSRDDRAQQAAGARAPIHGAIVQQTYVFPQSQPPSDYYRHEPPRAASTPSVPILGPTVAPAQTYVFSHHQPERRTWDGRELALARSLGGGAGPRFIDVAPIKQTDVFVLLQPDATRYAGLQHLRFVVPAVPQFAGPGAAPTQSDVFTLSQPDQRRYEPRAIRDVNQLTGGAGAPRRLEGATIDAGSYIFPVPQPDQIAWARAQLARLQGGPTPQFDGRTPPQQTYVFPLMQPDAIRYAALQGGRYLVRLAFPDGSSIHVFLPTELILLPATSGAVIGIDAVSGAIITLEAST
jgi:hypothetical protein